MRILVAQNLAVLERVPSPAAADRVVVLSGERVSESSEADLFPPDFHDEVDAAALALMEAMALGEAGPPTPLDWPLLDDLVRGWWLIDIRVHQALRAAVHGVLAARRILATFSPAEVLLASENLAIRDAAATTFGRAGVRVREASRIGARLGERRFRLPGLARGEEALRRLAARARGLPSPTGRKRPLVFVTFSGFWRPRDTIEPDLGTYTDAYIGEIIDETERRGRFWPLAVAVRRARGPMTLAGGVRHARRILSGTLPYLPLELFDNPGVRQAHAEAAAWTAARKAEIAALPPDRLRPLSVEGVDLWPVVRPALLRALNDVAPYVRRYHLFRRMIGRLAPAAVVQYGEAAPSGRALTWACVKENVPCLGIQHGIALGYEYLHPRTGARTRTAGPARGCPVPDVTFVYGPYWRDRLTGPNGYPDGAVESLGFHRMDAIFAARRDVDHLARSVLFLSSPTHARERAATLAALAEAARRLPGLGVTIKPHPMEGEMGADFDLTPFGTAARLAAPEEPIRPLLLAADLVVARDSTAVLEAVACGRPVICVNFSGSPTTFPHVPLGLAEGADHPGNLTAAIQRLLTDGDARRERVARADQALRALLAHAGPGATERIVSRIEGIAERG